MSTVLQKVLGKHYSIFQTDLTQKERPVWLFQIWNAFFIGKNVTRMTTFQPNNCALFEHSSVQGWLSKPKVENVKGRGLSSICQFMAKGI